MGSKRDRNRPKRDESDEVLARRWLNRADRELLPMIEGSAMSITINPTHPDAKVAVELGFCLLLDKPLVLLSFPDRPVPSRLRRAADLVIECTDPSDPEVARQIKEFLDALPDEPDDTEAPDDGHP